LLELQAAKDAAELRYDQLLNSTNNEKVEHEAYLKKLESFLDTSYACYNQLLTRFNKEEMRHRAEVTRLQVAMEAAEERYKLHHTITEENRKRVEV